MSDTTVRPLAEIATPSEETLANNARNRTAMAPVKHTRRSHLKDNERSRVIPSDVSETMNEIRDGLNVLFEDSVKRVKGTAHTIEHGYVVPVAQATGNFASANPLIFTFLAFFGFFSAIPFLIAIGILTFATSILAAAMLGIFAFIMTGMLLVAGAILMPILAFTAFISFIATSFLVGSFLATRLYLCISKRGFSDIPGGIMEFIGETRLRVLLALGLAADNAEPSDYAEEEDTVLITQIIVPPTPGQEIDERDEDEKTEVGYRESPERVKVEIIDIVPVSSTFGVNEGVGEGDNGGAKHTTRKAKREENLAGARSNLAHKDKESTVAQETGV